MSTVDLQQWREGVVGRSVRDFVRFKMSRQSRSERAEAMEGLFQHAVPSNVRGDLMAHAQAIGLLAHTKKFWALDCTSFFDMVTVMVRGSAAKRYVELTDDNVFDCFEFVTLGVTTMVDANPKVQRASGIGIRITLGGILLLGLLASALYLLLT